MHLPGPSSEASRPRRRGVLPARFRDDLDEDDSDGVICDLCSFKEPLGMADNTVFWIDCDLCGVWATVLFIKILFHANTYARNVHLNFFLFTVLVFNVTNSW